MIPVLVILLVIVVVAAVTFTVTGQRSQGLTDPELRARLNEAYRLLAEVRASDQILPSLPQRTAERVDEFLETNRR